MNEKNPYVHGGHADGAVVEMSYKSAVVEAIDEMAFAGMRPALIAFVSDDGRVEIYAWNTDPACLLRDLVETYGSIHTSVEDGH